MPLRSTSRSISASYHKTHVARMQQGRTRAVLPDPLRFIRATETQGAGHGELRAHRTTGVRSGYTRPAAGGWRSLTFLAYHSRDAGCAWRELQSEKYGPSQSFQERGYQEGTRAEAREVRYSRDEVAGSGLRRRHRLNRESLSERGCGPFGIAILGISGEHRRHRHRRSGIILPSVCTFRSHPAWPRRFLCRFLL